MVIELLDHRWGWIDAVLRAFRSPYIAQEFLNVDLQDKKRKCSVVVQMSNLMLETAIQDCKAKVGTIDD